jgi:hypothetical protein
MSRLILSANQLYSRRSALQLPSVGNLSAIKEVVKKVGNKETLVKRVFYSIGESLKGFAIGAILAQIPNAIFSISGLWEIFVTGALELYYFDWNIPDTRIDNRARESWRQFGGILGGSAGQAIGYFTCGVVPATTMFAFNEELALYVLRDVGEEAFEELTYEFAYALRLATRNLARQAGGFLFKNVRRWLKDPENPLGPRIFGGQWNTIREQWGAANAPSWSFAQKVEEKIEQIPGFFWQEFTEELIEEAIDACIEAGYVVTSSVESYWASQRTGRQILSDAKIVEIQPDRANDAEKIVLAGPEDVLRGQIPAVLATHQMVSDRDLGQLIGQPLDDWVRPRPIEGLRLKFQLFSFKSPPYSRRGDDRLVEVTITLSDVDRTKLDWERLRFVAGGSNGYLWGRFRARASLTNGRKLIIYGATEKEAVERVQAMLTLTDLEIKTLSVTEEVKEYERLRNPKMFKEITRVYPGYLSIINRERTLAIDRGKGSLQGNYVDKRARFDLWRATEPPDFEEKIRELLRRLDSTGNLAPP